MQLELKNIGKRYQNQWLFRHVNLKLNSGDCLSVSGANGSGKSTILQIIYGLVQPTEGEVLIDQKSDIISHRLFSFTSPGMELPFEFNIREIHDLYFLSGKTNLSLNEFLSLSQFNTHQSEKPVKLFSSGMQQRLKTALCFCSNAEVLLLDEPLTNMDVKGEIWYKNCVSQIQNRILIIAGNNPKEYENANLNIEISA